MNFKDILELIDKVAEKEISSVEIEQAGTRIKIEGKQSPPPVFAAAPINPVQHSERTAPPLPLAAAPQTVAEKAEAKRKEEEDSEAGLHIITSPIVGTFYRTPNPESEPFVNVGDRISKGKVLCIIEAMKLMNEIESDIEGTIAKIYPQNGQPVEYGEKLFAVKV
ncbi:MAG TPA: acetyl-CoA carboxylase biotin carboxyl carrier protein [Thermoanaerobaculia bacterium]|nr:acetyl-CoA carboxylase biotin carboxyl carrier protein [Thermoanaerobaculia bacterium]